MGSVKRLLPKKDLVGKVCGRLTVIRFDEYRLTGKTKDRTPFWIVRCSCGNERSIRQACLNCMKPTLSCGCYLKDFQKNVLPKWLHEKRAMPHGEASKNRIFADYKAAARNRDIYFELTRDEFVEIAAKNCHYCGVGPAAKYNFKETNGQFIYNGVDRKDNDVGYILNNCLPCCTTCNRAKRSMSYDEFINWIKRIKEYVRD